MIKPEIKRFGDRAVLLDWPDSIDIETHNSVLSWNYYLSETFGEVIEDLVPAYTSLCAFLRSRDHTDQFIRQFKDMEPPSIRSVNQNWHYHLPVCYHKEYGPDLDLVAEQLGLEQSKLVRLHTAPVYRVYFTGFLPGFPYLGGLDPQLWLARKASPRPLVPKGAVGIGGQQTGIYPSASPGGWNLIGNCPIPLFDSSLEPPALLQAGDALSFVPVSKDEYSQIREQLEQSTYSIIKKPIHA